MLGTRAWIDTNLEWLICKSIPPDIDPLSSLLLRCLDKLVYTATSHTYADILKKQFSLALTPINNEIDNNKPPRKRQAKILDYDSDQSTGSLTTVTNSTSSLPCNLLPHGTPKAVTVDYAAELASLRTELQSLWNLITTTVTQLKTEIASLHPTPESNDMETDIDHSKEITPNISELITELKHDIATIAIEMQAKFAQQATLNLTNNQKCTSATWNTIWTSVGLLSLI